MDELVVPETDCHVGPPSHPGMDGDYEDCLPLKTLPNISQDLA